MRRQGGFGVIAAIVILVLLSALSAAIVSLSTTQNITMTQDLLSARASQTARAGIEWGLFQAFSDGGGWDGGRICSAGTVSETSPAKATIDTSAINGFQATVSCWHWTFKEGETSPGVSRTVMVYQITSVACPAAPCPQTSAATANPAYVERRRVAVGI